MSASRAAAIASAPALLNLLLTPANAGVATWREGALVPTHGEVADAAIQDLLTLDVATRTDLPLLFGHENLSGTLAEAFEQPNDTWAQVLDSFFRLWRQRAFPAVAPDRLADSDLQALDVLSRTHRRLLDQQTA
jgi:hypothetical protein